MIDPKQKRYQLVEMTMTNKTNGRRSRIVVDKARMRTEIPDNYFIRFLKRQ